MDSNHWKTNLQFVALNHSAIPMYILLLLLPLITSLIFLLFGRYIGIKGSEKIVIITNIILFLLVNLLFYEIIYHNSIVELLFFNWILPNIHIGFIFDKQSTILIYLIINIYTIVINYSLWYMDHDFFKIRFLAYLNLFSFMMLLLVSSNNLFIMLIGWEGVGLTSYLLINFWFIRIQANKSAIKAIMWNKIGDLYYILGIVSLFTYYNIYNFNIYYISSPINIYIFSFFFIAAMAKSAQVFLDSWLGDAMEGPTPVSALLHAATMVTAGIFLLLRVLVNNTFNFLYYGSIIGLITIIISGLISLFQNDIKKIIAYSTCSQIGYMFYSEIIGVYNNSLYHLVIHGYFKALLFLSAGIIIHKMNNIQDIRQYGSIILNFPLTYLYFFIGTISIISFPFFSGFYSKDVIIEYSYMHQNSIYILSILGALLTVSYSFRLIKNVFYLKPKHKIIKGREPIFYSFIILIIGSLFLGYILKLLFFNTSFYISVLPFNNIDIEYIPLYIKILPIIITIIGAFIGINIDNLIEKDIKRYINICMPIYTFFNKRYFIDKIYNKLISIIEKNRIKYYIDNGILDIYIYMKRFFTLY